jgi:Flp pilus assembly protein TadG
MPALKSLRLIRAALDERGVAAIEFALVAPVAILLYCGFAELTMAMMAERRAAHVASVVADLVTQSTQVSNTEVADIFNVGGAIMKPFDPSTLKLRVTSVTADANGVPKMTWSQAHGMAAVPAGTVSGFPPNMLAANESLIMADVSYSYTSPLRMTMPSAMTFTDTFYLKPRRSNAVACPTC